MIANPPAIFGIPIDFLLFAATLAGVALLHHHVLKVALTGLVTITLYKPAVLAVRCRPGCGRVAIPSGP